jgi:hypothetical protein
MYLARDRFLREGGLHEKFDFGQINLDFSALYIASQFQEGILPNE